jgi:hypothetical protein
MTYSLSSPIVYENAIEELDVNAQLVQLTKAMLLNHEDYLNIAQNQLDIIMETITDVNTITEQQKIARRRAIKHRDEQLNWSIQTQYLVSSVEQKYYEAYNNVLSLINLMNFATMLWNIYISTPMPIYLQMYCNANQEISSIVKKQAQLHNRSFVQMNAQKLMRNNAYALSQQQTILFNSYMESQI